MSLRSRLLALAVTAALLTGAEACSRSGTTSTPVANAISTPLPTPTPLPIDPRALLREAGRVMEDLSSFHFRLYHRSGGTHLLPNLIIEEAEGDVIKPDKVSVNFAGTFGAFAIRASLITIGDSSYMTNPLTGQWELVPTEVSPLGFFNPRRGIASMLSQVDQVTLLSSDGNVHRLAGTLAAEALAPLVGETVRGVAIEVELTIDASNLYLLEAVFDGRVTPTEPEGTVRVVTPSRFGEPVAIEPPQ